MARFTTKMFAELPVAGLDKTFRTAVRTGAEKLMGYTNQEGRSMGVYDTGDTLASLKIKGPKRSKGGIACYITFEGIHTHGNIRRNAEVAFVNEYGARGKSPRPFNRGAVESHGEDINKTMEDIITDALK